MNSLAFLRLMSLAIAVILATSAQAQVDPAKNYPNKPIQVIVGFPPGGGTDIIARIVGQKLSEGLGQPVLVQTKVGAMGSIAAESVAKATPDGYTLMFAPGGVFTTNPVTYAKLPYSPVRDFVPISTVVEFPLFLIVNASQPIHSVKELVNYLKANPKNTYYSGSAGLYQLVFELFKLRSGTQIEYIPYKGNIDSVNAVIAGDVLMTISDPGTVTGALKGGRVRGLAVTAATRASSFPEMPTMAQAGIPDMEIGSWMGLFAPVGTPLAIVKKVQDEVIRVVKLSDVRERLTALQVNPVGNTSEEFARLIASELSRWLALAKASNIKPIN